MSTTDNQVAPLKDETKVAQDSEAPLRKSWRFWAIILSLSLTGLCSAIEGTIITSALPTITATLKGGNAYIWVPNAYFLASIATLPLFAQASNVFGRRWLILGAVALFVLGSGLCGGSSSMRMLIAARTVQGLGGGGIALMINIIMTDIVSLRERGKYMALTQMAATIGAALGPFIGGVITSRSSWRWVFYINLPIGGTAFVFLFFFLRLNYERNQSWKQRLARIDVFGNAVFITAVVAVLLALTWGGTIYEWGTYHIIVPLVLGFVGIGLFLAVEWTIVKEPSFPRKIVSNRTSTVALILTMIHTLCTYWAFYFLPIYFQAVQGKSVMRSGIDTLPIFAGILPFGIIGGILLSKIGRYKPLHIVGWIPVIIAFGLFSLLTPGSPPGAWVCFQLLCAIGAGLLASILLPAVQAPLDEGMVATATGVWSFARGFGSVWGVTIPSAIFNNQCRKNAAALIQDPDVAQYLTGGKAYQYATQEFLNSIEDQTSRAQVVEAFHQSLRTVWYVGVAFAALGFLLTFVEKEIELRRKLNTKFGMEEKKEGQQSGNQEAGEEAHDTPAEESEKA
ncbi:major facilitator superfamily MFS_1 [Aspergillus affinis]|uniref:major facilitator superfamily MFS_1 n=1 Tax=Aspergillus affinis TaxID=1070780 RepID=UPI0022FDCF6C|nr:major facilitator superfamily MFS_1 [Aspergillus affinis]KAI9037318.1 major facilitator superfamily MFS_1 [Aspergillus affinis]